MTLLSKLTPVLKIGILTILTIDKLCKCFTAIMKICIYNFKNNSGTVEANANFKEGYLNNV